MNQDFCKTLFEKVGPLGLGFIFAFIIYNDFVSTMKSSLTELAKANTELVISVNTLTEQSKAMDKRIIRLEDMIGGALK